MAAAHVTAAQLITIAALPPFGLTIAANAATDMLVTVTASSIDLDLWGDLASEAHTLLALHHFALGGGGGSTGLVTSRSIGQISESYSVSADASLSSTQWGRMFLELRASLSRSTNLAVVRSTDVPEWAPVAGELP